MGFFATTMSSVSSFSRSQLQKEAEGMRIRAARNYTFWRNNSATVPAGNSTYPSRIYVDLGTPLGERGTLRSPWVDTRCLAG
jgi:hypothetical protein